MPSAKYLIIGSSHAGLSALDAIRLQDTEGSVTLITRDESLPYSPTILPYVVSGDADPEKIFLRDQKAMDHLNVTFLKGETVTTVDTKAHSVRLSSGENLSYEKLLLATGATPVLPPVTGLEDEPHHVLRTLDDAMKLRTALENKHTALVVGAGLIGMHAAENLAKIGVDVTIVEALPHVLPDYFDEDGASLIQQAFSDKGIKMHLGCAVKQVAGSNGAQLVTLNSGETISSDLVLVATGVRPSFDYLSEADIEVDQGILVDDRMRTSADGVWAAGDVVQAPGFFDSEKRLNGTLPDASEQGRIAGMDMVGDSALKPYKGGIGMNTYKFFGHRAFSIGLIKEANTGSDGREEDRVSAPDLEEDRVFSPASQRYQKLVFQDDRLVGALSINMDLDPGVMFEVIRRRIDLKDMKAQFVDHPQETGRILMTKVWR
jgi:phenylglyoxylate dehydrogenase epsilon subunit